MKLRRGSPATTPPEQGRTNAVLTFSRVPCANLMRMALVGKPMPRKSLLKCGCYCCGARSSRALACACTLRMLLPAAARLSPRLAHGGGTCEHDNGGIRILVIDYRHRFATNRSILAERNTPFFSGKIKEILGMFVRGAKLVAVSTCHGRLVPAISIIGVCAFRYRIFAGLIPITL